MKEEVLRSLGLSDKEVKIYLANLQLGNSLVQEIANFAGLNRTSAYDLLKSLEQKGFVSYVIQSGKKYYQSAQPNKIVNLLKEKEDSLMKVIPDLNNIAESVGKRPKVEVYIGKNGLKTVFEDILNEAKECKVMASNEQLNNLFENYIPNFAVRRKKKRINVKIICDKKLIDKKLKYKVIKKNIKTATWLYNGKIAMISLEKKEPTGIIIVEKNFYATQEMMFDILWDVLGNRR